MKKINPSEIRILVVNDDANVARGTAQLLQQAGYATATAANGVEALPTLHSLQPHLVLSDRDMPVMGGMELCRRIKTDPALADVFVILLSGVNVASEEQAEGLESGADGYITRPIANRELLARVAAFVRILRLNHDLRRNNAELAAANRELQKEVAERQRAEAALRVSEERLELVIQASTDGVWDWNLQTGQADLSPRYCEIIGYRAGEATFNLEFFKHLVHPLDWPAVETTMNEHLAGKTPKSVIEYRMTAKDGKAKWIVGCGKVVARAANGTPLRMIGTISDITERKQAEVALRVSEERFRAILEQAPIPVSLGREGFILFANEAYRKLFGTEPHEEFVGRPLLERYAPQCREVLREYLDSRSLRQPAPAEYESVGLRTDGSQFPILVTVGIIQLQDGPANVAFVADITERKHIEQTLRESEERYRQLFELESDAVVLVDCETHRFVTANPAALRLYGYTQEEFLQLTPEQLSDEPEKTRASVGSGQVFIPLRWHRRKNGERFMVEITANSFQLRGRSTELATLRDITIRQRAMEMLQEATQQLQEAQRIARLGMYSFDVQTGLWSSCEVLNDIFGIAASGFTRDVTGWLQLVHPLDRAEMERYLAVEILQQKRAFDHVYRIVRVQDQQERWVHGLGKLVWDEHGRVARMSGIIQDITESKRAEETLERLATAVEQSAEVIVITDTAGKILYANPAFETCTGYTPMEAIGQNPRILKSGRHDREFYRQLWDTLGRGEVWTGHFINRRKDGTLFEEEASISPVRNVSGTIVNYVAVKRDITREVELEKELRQAQKLEAVGQLAGGVAHDFNNLLSSQFLQIELLNMEANLPADVREGLEQIHKDGQRAANLVRQLLLFSRRKEMRSHDLDLNAVITDLARMLRRTLGENVELRLNQLRGLPLIHADAGMMEQVLMNLAVNARDAMPAGGAITIETLVATLDDSMQELFPEAVPGRYVCLRVSDTGTGIPPEILPRIFEPFFTTKEVGRGTGLGLATVFGIVKQHRGAIKVANQPGRGAAFEIFLPPVNTCSSAPPATAPAAKPARSGNETILLVEDEPALRLPIQKMLTRHGYTVLAAADGLEALGVWRKHAGTIALLLTDQIMPGTMNGQELADQLLAEQPQLKVILTSGYNSEIAGRELNLRAGMMFMQKPIGTEALLATIRRCLEA